MDPPLDQAVQEDREPCTMTTAQLANLLQDLSLLDYLPADARREITKLLIPSQKAVSKPECQFLDKLPPEVRNEVYRHALVNPNLAERSYVEKDNQYRRRFTTYASGEPIAYGLSPALLRTSKQIYREASHVLYEENTFLVLFGLYNVEPISPLARYPSFPQAFNQSYPHPSLKARRWKVIIDISNDQCDASFNYFCRLLARSPPHSLEIFLLPVWNLDEWPEWKIREWLQPFSTLRNIDKFTLSDAPIAEREPVTTDYWSTLHGQRAIYALSQVQGWDSLTSKLKLSAEGNFPVELIPEMHNCLVLYYASFERYEPFRSIIERQYRCDSDIFLGLIGHIKHHGCFEAGTLRPHVLKLEHVQSELKRERPRFQNAILGRDYPPLISTLSKTYKTATRNEDIKFKMHRAEILNHLEPHYQRIVAASKRIAAFVDEQRRWTGILETVIDPVYQSLEVWTEKHYESVDLLEEYANALKTRDTMIEDQAAFKLQQGFLESHYRTLPAESAIRELRVFVGRGEHYGFRDLFKRALDDLDSQYLNIRKARMALYSCDQLNEPGCTIGLDEDPLL